jgi:putative transposase
VQLGIMDGLSGLEKVFQEEFANAKIQRCHVHVSRNVLSKVTHSKKTEVADKLGDIFYVSSRTKAMEFYNQFVYDYERMIPSAINSLKSNIDSCLSFFSFPKDE